nr:MAG TPA: hypothetical protein [Caudoviricetes sp.]
MLELQQIPRKAVWATLPEPRMELAAMLLTTTFSHLQLPTAGNARPRRSCASHTKRWTGECCCAACFRQY